MKCNKSQMATLTMWKIFMVLLLAMALLMPVTLARLHSTSGVGMSGGGSSMGPGGGGSGSGGISSKDSHVAAVTECFGDWEKNVDYGASHHITFAVFSGGKLLWHVLAA
uniref:HDC02594 n=1 Tax=Drosophila melanogaster TaxID=7227 RepID=Q6IHG8_DROME|nr:TPA_inf: HDC02594 [Drosophila melanogaster]